MHSVLTCMTAMLKAKPPLSRHTGIQYQLQLQHVTPCGLQGLDTGGLQIAVSIAVAGSASALAEIGTVITGTMHAQAAAKQGLGSLSLFLSLLSSGFTLGEAAPTKNCFTEAEGGSMI